MILLFFLNLNSALTNEVIEAKEDKCKYEDFFHS